MAKKPAKIRSSRNGAKPIKIRVQGDDITVDPTAAHFAVGDRVEWQLDMEDGALLVLLNDGEVLGDTKYRVRPQAPASGTAKKRGIFHYQVAVYANGEVHADAGCPTIIIR